MSDMPATPQVSVCVITYNHERYIREALEGALAQETSFPYEVVVGEDCSTDGTLNIVNEIAARHPEQMRVLSRSKNLGLHANYFDTLQQCRGEFIAVLEGDDYWTSPNKLSRQHQFLKEHPECSICGHRATPFGTGQGVPKRLPRSRKPAGVYRLEDLLLDNMIVNCTAMFRRSVVSTIPDWWHTASPHDWCLALLCAEQGHAGLLDDDMVAYRMHPDSVTQSTAAHRRRTQRMAAIECVDRHFGGRFHQQLNRARARLHYAAARELLARDDRPGAREAIRHAVRLGGLPESLRGKNARTIVGACLPGALEAVEVLRQSVSAAVRLVGQKATGRKRPANS